MSNWRPCRLVAPENVLPAAEMSSRRSTPLDQMKVPRLIARARQSLKAPMRTSAWILLLAVALFAVGCSTRDPRFREETVYLGGHRSSPEPQRANFDNVSYWDGDGVSGSPFVRIAL